MTALQAEIAACRICAEHLPHGVRPVASFSSTARLLIIGQAPGSKVHESGIPWDDASGDRLREWTGLSKDEMYDPTRVALVPMGFCYPGKASGGDKPPRPECAAMWHARVLAESAAGSADLAGRHIRAARLFTANQKLDDGGARAPPLRIPTGFHSTAASRMAQQVVHASAPVVRGRPSSSLTGQRGCSVAR